MLLGPRRDFQCDLRRQWLRAWGDSLRDASSHPKVRLGPFDPNLPSPLRQAVILKLVAESKQVPCETWPLHAAGRHNCRAAAQAKGLPAVCHCDFTQVLVFLDLLNVSGHDEYAIGERCVQYDR